MSKIKEQQGIRIQEIVANPELVKVRTIKKKFVEQMPTIDAGTDIPIGAEVVGRTENHVILLVDDRRLLKVFVHVYLQWMIGGVQFNDDDDKIAQAMETIDRFKQLFED